MKKYFYQVPIHVSTMEAAELYEYMATGEATRIEYLDKRNQIIFDSLEHLTCQLGRVGTQDLIQYLTEYRLLENVGGLTYVQRVFNSLEPEEAICL